MIRPVVPDDLAPAYELLARRDRHLVGVAETAEQHLRERWALPGFRGWVADEEGELAGYASLDAARELEHVATDAASGAALLEAALAAAGGPVSLTAFPEDVETVELLGGHGFVLDRTILRMWRPLRELPPAAAWPDRVAVRGYVPSDAGAVHELLDRAYAGWDPGYVARPHDDWLAFMTGHEEFDPALWLLAERDGRLAGCALLWRVTSGRGWVKDLVVSSGERGQGLGRALLVHGLRASAAAGAEAVGLKVDASNPTGAPELYASAGFAVDRRYDLWTRP